MGIQVGWEQDQRTSLIFKFDRTWSWIELRKKMRLAFALSRTVDYSVGIIFDLSETLFFPDEPIQHVRGLIPHLPPNWNTIVIISAAQYAADIFNPIYDEYRDKGLLFLLVQTMEQAQVVLEHERRRQMSESRATLY